MINIKRTHITGTYTRGKRTYTFDIERHEEYCWVLTTDDLYSDCCHMDGEEFVCLTLEGCMQHLNALAAMEVA